LLFCLISSLLALWTFYTALPASTPTATATSAEPANCRPTTNSVSIRLALWQQQQQIKLKKISTPTSTTQSTRRFFYRRKVKFLFGGQKNRLAQTKTKTQKIENFITTNSRAFRILAISFVICGAINEIEICNCSHKVPMFGCKIQETQITSAHYTLRYTK